MKKYKIVKKKGNTQVVHKSQKGQQLCDRELQAINSGKNPGLIPVEITQKGAVYLLQYDISRYIFLKDYLKTPLTKGAFTHMLKNILTTLKELQEQFVSQNYVLLDTDYVTVNPTNGQIYFICIPLQFYDTETNLKEFLLSIIRLCSFANTENTDYVGEYISILNRGTNFSAFELDEYVNKLSGTSKMEPATAQKQCPKCQALLRSDSKYCTACGYQVVKTTMFSEKIFDPLAESERLAERKPVTEYTPPVEKKQPLFYTPTSEVISPAESEAVSKGEPEHIPEIKQTPAVNHADDLNEMKTVLLNQDAYIIRQATSEKVKITTFPFTIGKSAEKATYAVPDNETISRQHVRIEKKGVFYFLTDLNSTNGTCINGIVIEPNAETKLLSGMKITLSNEDFVFIVE